MLHLLKETDPLVVGDADMAGPLVFCFAFMATMLLGGKVAFGYIYGLGLMGCLGMYLLLNLMSVSTQKIDRVILREMINFNDEFRFLYPLVFFFI